MKKINPIVLLDNDAEELEFLEGVFGELRVPNELLYFSNGPDALQYLHTTKTQPFIIIADINMPGMDGIEFRRQINQDKNLRRKTIPFIFLTTTATQATVEQAYDMSVQGFFEKPKTFPAMVQLMDEVYRYWSVSKRPC